jgi:DNA repair protein RadD
MGKPSTFSLTERNYLNRFTTLWTTFRCGIHSLLRDGLLILLLVYSLLLFFLLLEGSATFPGAIVIGVTASPQRLSGEPLSDIFDDMILGPSVSELIAMGHLSKFKAFAPPGIDTSNIQTRAGDFAKGELSAAADRPTITGDVIREYARLAAGKRAVVFCVSIDHAKNVAAQFNAHGFPSTSLDGKMSRDLRRETVRDFRDGRIKVMTSCDIISEGFDLPAIEVAVSLRPTKSLALWIQQSGRALRPFPGKEYALLLDHSGNIERHGLPDDERSWSLEGRGKRKKSERATSVKVCPKCFAAQFSGRSSCSYCGYVFDVQPREVEHVEGELIEIDPMALRLRREQERSSARTLDELISLAKIRKYKNPYGWAQHVYNARQAKKTGGSA